MSREKVHRGRVYLQLGEPSSGTLIAVYARNSMNLENPATITTQIRKMNAYAASRSWTIVRCFIEPDESAHHEEIERRPRFAEMLDAARSGEFQAILCFSSDRWARNSAVAHRSLEQLRHAFVWWATVDGKWDIDRIQQDGYDVAFAIDAQHNARYSRNVSERTIEGKEARAYDGYHNGKPPFGYLPPDYPKAPDGAASTWRPPRMPVREHPINFPALRRIGEMSADGFTDAAIADALKEYISSSPRFGDRPLSKDTVTFIRRMWFPREFAPGCGHGTIETPAGELVEGLHPAAWPYELWQRMVRVKDSLYHPAVRTDRQRIHEFSRIIVCAACRHALRVGLSHSVPYYRDTSNERQLPCSAFGCLSVKSEVVIEQFGSLLSSITLPPDWQDMVAQRATGGIFGEPELVRQRRLGLEAKRQSFVQAFNEGRLTEYEFDLQTAPIKDELHTLPEVRWKSVADYRIAVLAAGEGLLDVAHAWHDMLPEERRESVWALLEIGGLIYDLERECIVGLIPRPDVAPVLEVGLGVQWVERANGLWRVPDSSTTSDDTTELRRPHMRSTRLPISVQDDVVSRLRSGRSISQVATEFNLSFWVVRSLMKRHAPQRLTPQQQPKLTVEQQSEALARIDAGMSTREVGKSLGVSCDCQPKSLPCDPQKSATWT